MLLIQDRIKYRSQERIRIRTGRAGVKRITNRGTAERPFAIRGIGNFRALGKVPACLQGLFARTKVLSA